MVGRGTETERRRGNLGGAGTRPCPAQGFLEAGNLLQRAAQHLEIARVARADAEPADGTFQIAHFRQSLAQAFQRFRVFDQRLDGRLAPADGFDVAQRLREPVAQAPRPHRRDGAVERAVKSGRARGVAVQRFENLQMLERRGIEVQEVRGLIKRKRRQMRHVAPQMLGEIVQDRAGRAHRGHPVPKPKTVEGRDLEVLAHGELGVFRRENPVVVAVRDRERILKQALQGGRFTGKNDFGGAEPFQLRHKAGLVFDFGRFKTARR